MNIFKNFQFDGEPHRLLKDLHTKNRFFEKKKISQIFQS